MEITVKKLPGSLVEISVEINPEDARPHLESAAARLSKERPIDGFRPGHAPYESVVRAYGDMAIHETALQTAVVKTYAKAVTDNGIQTYGEPKIEVKKLVPGEGIAFTATVAVVPKVTGLADLKKISVRKEPKKVGDSDVDRAINELCRMRTKESAVSRPVESKDKVVVDMDMKVDGVPIEGGQARNHGIYLDEEYYVPGLKEKLIGSEPEQTLVFNLPFPKDHFQKTLAGKDVEFTVTVRQVFRLEPPAADDELAKSLGQESMSKLRELIAENMGREAEETARRQAQEKVIDLMLEKTGFEDIPDIMVNQEVHNMIHELEHDLSHRGLDMDRYLESIGRSLGQLKLDFAANALKRVKVALMMRAIGDSQGTAVSDAEVLEEQGKLVNRYANDPEAQERVRGDDFADYLRANIRNRKIMEYLTENAVID
ncbi:trigger factor [Candidatus Uhrbacteria bacterium]|nr:trigger factor [Candidatus Uhrbacteria bacterium]